MNFGQSEDLNEGDWRGDARDGVQGQGLYYISCSFSLREVHLSRKYRKNRQPRQIRCVILMNYAAQLPLNSFPPE